MIKLERISLLLLICVTLMLSTRPRVTALLRKFGAGGYVTEDNIVELYEEDIDATLWNSTKPWVVAFYSLQGIDSRKLEPEFAMAAWLLKGKINVGALDSATSPEKAVEYGVERLPTVIFFPEGMKRKSEVEAYRGLHSSDAMVRWALDKWKVSMTAEVFQLVRDGDLQKECVKKSPCVIAILPHILDCNAECRKFYLETFRANSKPVVRKGWDWGWLWMQTEDHVNLERALDIHKILNPLMVVVDINKGRYTVLSGPFGDKSVDEYLNDNAHGKGSSYALQGSVLPTVKTIEPWDGKDGVEPHDQDEDEEDEEEEIEVKDEL